MLYRITRPLLIVAAIVMLFGALTERAQGPQEEGNQAEH